MNKKTISAIKLFVIFATVFVMSLQPSTTFAAFRLDDEQSRIGNQILNYSPNDTCGDAAIEPVVDINTSGDTNAEAILRFFVGKGMKLAAAAGFVGNMKAESGLNPLNVENATQDAEPNASVNGKGDAKLAQDNGGKQYIPIDGTGFGLVQWTFGGYKKGSKEDPEKFDSRQGGLYQMSKELNKDIGDINLQLAYVWQELNVAPYKSNTLAVVSNMTDPVEAAIAVEATYEISGDTDSEVRTNRGGSAQSYYDQFKDKIADGSGATSSDTQVTTSTGETCSAEVTDTGGVGEANGLTFPLKTTQSKIKAGVDGSVWCYSNQNNCHHDYNAADIFSKTGTPILAAKPGKVVSKTTDSCIYAGCNVSIKGDDGLLYYYTHMSKQSTVSVGQTIQAGQQIGAVGTNATAMNTTQHLHFDITRGAYRPSCSGSACNDSDFINVQPILIPAFQALPTGKETADV